jgi:hypothetical protein
MNRISLFSILLHGDRSRLNLIPWIYQIDLRFFLVNIFFRNGASRPLHQSIHTAALLKTSTEVVKYLLQIHGSQSVST